ncbi:short-chain dehydrogenase/reductase SDR [Arthrobacter sp. PAMC 25486]|uniref:SDR family NAD(P)-dependent oxidoreductase n=1 Tax=Arthrobacter sp. PAMC 25486 TaxID=1494608 RepID=UPI0005361E63|nr:SDR family NAD(P)-dependent oxidoreductase [Arthrobacter sp. PAMC 25486]AIY00153.1 short-chain dehydrogenase/reductase SDR [Arthrobacter sp. PAMC 25486]
MAKALAAQGLTVFIGSRDLARGQEAVSNIGHGAMAVQLDVTDAASIAATADRINREAGRRDVLVNNAGISNTLKGTLTMDDYVPAARASRASLDEVRAVWDVNVFGVLAVYQAMLPLLAQLAGARIINVSNRVGSLAANADPRYPAHGQFGPTYPASQAVLSTITLAIMVELEQTGFKVNLVSPGFTSTNLNNFAGTQSVEDGSREVVRGALLGQDGPTGIFTRWENETIPW